MFLFDQKDDIIKKISVPNDDSRFKYIKTLRCHDGILSK